MNYSMTLIKDRSTLIFLKNKTVDSLDWDNTDDLSYLGLSREYRTQIKLLCKLEITGRNLRTLRWFQGWLKERLQHGILKRGVITTERGY